MGSLFIALFAALVLGAAGCSERPDVLARVGNEAITRADFVEAARSASERYSGDADSAKALLLNDLIHRRLMAMEARKLSSANPDIVEGIRQHIESEILVNTLLDRLVPIPEVSEAEVRLFHAWRDSAAHLQVIYHPDQATVRAALAEIRRGAEFSQVADRFNLAGLLPPGGDLGFLVAGALVNPLDRLLRDAPIGKLVGPIEAPGEGWFLVRVLERRARQSEPYDQVRVQLREMLRQRKRRALSALAFRELKRGYRLAIEPGAPQILFARFNRAPSNDPATATDEPLDTVLARYDGGPSGRGAFTLLDALRALETDTEERPNPTMLTSFEQWLESQLMKRIVLLEARRRQIGQEPTVARKIAERMNGRLIDDLYHAEVEEKTQVTERDRRVAIAQLGLEGPSIDALDASGQEKVHETAFAIAAERRLQTFLKSLTDRYPVQTYSGRLRAIRWPITGPAV